MDSQTPIQRVQHIENLIRQYDIHVCISGSYEFDIKTRKVHLKSWEDIKSQEGYLSALHEIGHYCCGHHQPNDWNQEANMELSAWAWAFHHCQEHLDWHVVKQMLSYALLPSPN
jgi:hypothetical protein